MRAEAGTRVADRQGADALVAAILDTIGELESVLAAEGEHVRAGRLRQGLTDADDKGALAARYLQGLETAKANAVALARFAPEGVARLRAAHRRFAEAVETNQAVLATARSVSEGLIRTLAEDIGRGRSATVYGASVRTPSPYGDARAVPLVLSRCL